MKNTDWNTESGAFKLNNSPSAGSNWYVKVYHTLDLSVVDEDGNPIPDARVYLTDGQGNIVFEPTTALTDSNGEIEQQTCLVWWAYIDEADSWSRKNTDYKDYTIKIVKSGYKPYEHKWSFKDTGAVKMGVTLKKILSNNQHTSVEVKK
jgi:hypothetical protein